MYAIRSYYVDFFEEYAEIKNATAESALAKEYEYLPKDIKVHIEGIEEEIRQKNKEKLEKTSRAQELQEVIDHYRNEESSINTLKELVPEAEKINLELGSINSGIARNNFV